MHLFRSIAHGLAYEHFRSYEEVKNESTRGSPQKTHRFFEMVSDNRQKDGKNSNQRRTVLWILGKNGWRKIVHLILSEAFKEFENLSVEKKTLSTALGFEPRSPDCLSTKLIRANMNRSDTKNIQIQILDNFFYYLKKWHINHFLQLWIKFK